MWCLYFLGVVETSGERYARMVSSAVTIEALDVSRYLLLDGATRILTLGLG